MKTDAIVFNGVNEASYEKIEMAPVTATDAIVEVEFSGVSVGTEVWALTGQRPPGDTGFPCVPGYQAVGVVKAAGQESALTPGERIFFTKSKLVAPHSVGNWMGSHVRYAVVDAKENPQEGYWVRVPENVSAEDAALSALGAVAERGLLHVGVNPGDFCVVVGQGVIGQMSAQVAKIHGAHVVGVDIEDSRLEISAKHSCDAALNAAQCDILIELQKMKPGGVDLSIEASGNKKLIPQAISLIRVQGRVLLQGWYPGDVSFNFQDAHNRRPTIAATSGMDRECNQRVMDWLAEGVLKIAPLITARFKPQQAQEAYAMMRDKPSDFLGVIFDWR